MLEQDYISKLLDLKDVIVTKVETEQKELHIHMELPVEEHICPCCGQSTSYVHDYREQIIKDIPLLDEKMAEQLFGRDVTRKFRHKIKRKYDKLIHLRLGRERYIETD